MPVEGVRTGGASIICMIDEPDAALLCEMDGRRVIREIEDRLDELLVMERRRWGERGAGEPG